MRLGYSFDSDSMLCKFEIIMTDRGSVCLESQPIPKKKP